MARGKHRSVKRKETHGGSDVLVKGLEVPYARYAIGCGYLNRIGRYVVRIPASIIRCFLSTCDSVVLMLLISTIQYLLALLPYLSGLKMQTHSNLRSDTTYPTTLFI